MENDSPVIVFAQPTVKDQLIATAIGIGATFVMLFALAGFSKLTEKIDQARLRRKAKKLAKAAALLEKETKPE